jgi:hypothetical protein
MSDYEVIWDGRGPLPGIGEGLGQKSHPMDALYALGSGVDSKAVNAVKRSRVKTRLTGEARIGADVCPCDEPLNPSEIKKGYRRCGICRGVTTRRNASGDERRRVA